MLYYLFDYIEKQFNLPGASVFTFISFRAFMATLASLFISIVWGKWIIRKLQLNQMGEEIRDLGLQGQMEKRGTPTMGGIIIIMAIVIPTLLFTKLENIYIILVLGATILLACIGFADDYMKLKRKNKDGIQGKFKIFGQIAIGAIVALVLSFHPDVVVRSYEQVENSAGAMVSNFDNFEDLKSTITTIPFLKNNEFDYDWLTSLFGSDFTWIAYMLIVIFIVVAVSNGANLTDGLDGLAAGTSAIAAATLALLAWVSGNAIFADYLNIMYLPRTGELVIFCASLVGACIGFLWYNSYPAQVFMGDTGSLTLGGVIAVLAFIIRKELLIPIFCGIFLIENLSVILQVSYFKYSRKKYGEGRRIFLMSPLHHHYQKKNYHEVKIVNRFWIVGILLAILSLVTLKLR